MATVTDAGGNFSTAMPSGSNTIVVSYVGYTSQEVHVTSGYANIVMNPGNEALDEVVVVGYGISGENLIITTIMIAIINGKKNKPILLRLPFTSPPRPFLKLKTLILFPMTGKRIR